MKFSLKMPSLIARNKRLVKIAVEKDGLIWDLGKTGLKLYLDAHVARVKVLCQFQKSRTGVVNRIKITNFNLAKLINVG